MFLFFQTEIKNNSRGQQGVIIVCDVTDKSSYNSIRTWVDRIQRYAGEDVVTLVVGNQIDFYPRREVSTFEARKKVGEFNLPYFEVSAKSGENVDESFMFLVREMIQIKIRKGELVFFFFLFSY